MVYALTTPLRKIQLSIMIPWRGLKNKSSPIHYFCNDIVVFQCRLKDYMKRIWTSNLFFQNKLNVLLQKFKLQFLCSIKIALYRFFPQLIGCILIFPSLHILECLKLKMKPSKWEPILFWVEKFFNQLNICLLILLA